MDDISTGTLLGALGVLLVVSGFFSIAETSMMAVNRYRIRHLAQHGSSAAQRVIDLLAQTDKLLGVILLGNNLINAAAATLTTIITVRLFGQGEWQLMFGTLAVTFAILVFAEITPKVVGANHPERIALPASYILGPMLRLASPVVWFVNLFVNGLLSLLRLRARPEDSETRLSPEELRTLVLEASHILPAKHHNILVNLFDLSEITVDDVMTPRSSVEAIDLTDNLEQLQSQLATSYHTRVPAYEKQLDNIVGILHLRQVLHLRESSDWSVEALRSIARPAYFIPSGTPLLTQLQHFQESQQRLGLVVDEYGEMLGLVTLDDILEEIIGEFTTQNPSASRKFRLDNDDTAIVDGSAPLRLLNRKLGTGFPIDGPKTLNGLILEHFGDIPEAGISLKIGNHPLEILQTQDRAVRTVRLHLPKPD